METNEQILTDFMRSHYSDEKLIQLLEHAESGKLSYRSCCCFIGIVNADHALRGQFSSTDRFENDSHVFTARLLPGFFNAEKAFQHLWDDPAGDLDAQRRAKLIPLIKAEIMRRAAEVLRAEMEVSEMVVV